MKFLEDEPNRLLKRVQTIYKALKSGTVKIDDGRVFEYDLIKPTFSIVGRKKWETIVHYYPHGFHLQYDRTPRTLSIEDVDNYVDTIHSRLNVKITKDYGKPIPRETIKKKIQDKFRDFGIFLSYGEVKFNKMYTPEPIDNINEEVSNEKFVQIITRLKKRSLLIYKALGEGHVVVNCGDDSGLNFKLIKLRYVLPENPRINIEDRFDDKDKIVEYGALMAGGSVKMYYTPQDNSCDIDWYEAVAPIRKKFRSLDIQIVFDGIDLIEEKSLNEAVLRKPEKQDISPEERERIEKKVNVVMKAITKMPFTILEHKVKIKIPDYRMVVHPPNIIKFTNEFDQPEYQVTEPDVRIHADDAFVYTDSEETYKYFTNEVKRDDLIYNVYHAIRNRLQKFNISFTLFDTYIRFEDNNNDLQEQFEYGDDDGEEDYIYVDNGTPSQEKKIKVLYKAFKEGYIKMRFDGELYKFRYVLPNKFGAKYSKVSDAMTLLVPKFSIKLYGTNNQLIYPNNPVTKQLHLTAYRLVSRRFQINFGVIFEEPPVGYDKYQSINGDLQEQFEQDDDTIPITDKDRKKIRAVFAAFGAGIINQKGTLPKVRYKLANHYMIKKSLEEKRLSMVLVGKSFKNVIIHIINEDGTETNVTPFSGMWNGLLWVVGRRVEVLFKRYDIDVVLNLF